MNNELIEKNETEISVFALWEVLKKFFWVIAVFSVIVAALFGAYSALFVKTKYSASAKYTVVNMLSNTEYIADTMISAASNIAGVFVEVADENIAVSAAVDEGELDKYFGCTKEEAIVTVSKMVSAKKQSEDSPLFSITITAEKKEDVLAVITAFQKIIPGIITQMNTIGEEDQVTTTAKPVSVVNSIDNVEEINPSVVRNAIVGFVAAFVIVYFICFIIYIRDTKVYDDYTVKSNFNYPVIGVIPVWDDGEGDKKSRLRNFGKKINPQKIERDYRGKLLNAQTPFAVAEAFNSLRTNLCYSVTDVTCPVYSVTSDFSGAGKSVVSVNIATSLAMLGKKTLLIECDLRRPKINSILGTDEKKGLSELLSGVIPDAQSVIKTVDNDLDVIYAGHTPPNPTLLLGSDRMKSLIEQFKNVYDVIILDTPPVFEVADACVVTPLVDGNIVVARSEYSDVNALKSSIDLLTGVEGRIIGFVVNDVDIKISGAYKNRYSRYGKYRKYARYSNYYADANKKAKEN